MSTDKAFQKTIRFFLFCLLLLNSSLISLNAQRRAEFEVDATQDGLHRSVAQANNTVTWKALNGDTESAHAPVIFWGTVNPSLNPCVNTPVNPQVNPASGTCQIVPVPTLGVYVYQYCQNFGAPPCTGLPVTGRIRIKKMDAAGEDQINSDQIIAIQADGMIGPAVANGEVVHLRTMYHKDSIVTFTGASPCFEDVPMQTEHKGPCVIKGMRNKNYTFHCAASTCTDPVIHVLDADGLAQLIGDDKLLVKADLSRNSSRVLIRRIAKKVDRDLKLYDSETKR